MIKMIKKYFRKAGKSPVLATLLIGAILAIPILISYGAGETSYIYSNSVAIEEWWGAQACDGTNGNPNYATPFEVSLSDDNNASASYNDGTPLCGSLMFDNMDGETLISKSMQCFTDTHIIEVHLENNNGSFDTARVYRFLIEGNVLECGNIYSGLTVVAGEGGGGGDVTAPTLSSVTPVTTPTTDTTPDFTFVSDEDGILEIAGDCSTATDTTVTADVNKTITLDSDGAGAALAAGTYSNCTVTVTDEADNASDALAINTFIVQEADVTAPTLAIVSSVENPTTDTTPDFTFTSNEGGTLAVSGSCYTSSSTSVEADTDKTITLTSSASGSVFSTGTYSDCSVTVTDASDNTSSPLAIGNFTVAEVRGSPSYTAPTADLKSLKQSDNQVDIVFNTYDIDEGEQVSVKIEYKTDDDYLWKKANISKVSSSSALLTPQTDPSLDFQVYQILPLINKPDIKAVWNISELDIEDFLNIEVRITPFDGRLQGESSQKSTTLNPAKEESEESEESSTTSEENPTETAEVDTETTEETDTTDSADDTTETKEKGGEEIKIINEETKEETNTDNNEEETTNEPIEKEESGASDNTPAKSEEVDTETTEEDKLTTKSGQKINSGSLNNEIEKEKVEQIAEKIIESLTAAKNETEIVEAEAVSDAPIVVETEGEAADTNVVENAENLFKVSGPLLHKQEVVSIKPALKYNQKRPLFFKDIGRYNPAFIAANYLKNSYLEVMGQKQYVFNGNLATYNQKDFTVKAELQQSLTRQDWLQMVMTSHGLPIYKVSQLPAVRYDRKALPKFSDVQPNDENITANIIYSASYYGLLEGSKGQANPKAALAVPEAVKILIKAGELISGENYPTATEKLNSELSEKEWYYNYYAKAAQQNLFKTLLKPERLQTSILKGEAIEALFELMLSRNNLAQKDLINLFSFALNKG